jgi:hypothetical protein
MRRRTFLGGAGAIVLMSARVVGAHRTGQREGASAPLPGGDGPAFPPSATTDQERLDWLAAEIDRVVEAVEAEGDKPVAQQREAVFVDMFARGADLERLADAIPGRSSRLKARVSETMTRAKAGLERIANGKLRIGMTAEQVREIRGEPARVSLVRTATGVRQLWAYGRTVLFFDDGRLAEIVLMLTGDP